MLLICFIAESKRDTMELVNSTRRLTAQPFCKRADSRCPDRHVSAPDMLHHTCITSETPTIISKPAEPERTSQDAALCVELRVMTQRCAGIYESGCSVVRGCTSQDAALCVDLRVRMQRCSWIYESGYYMATALQCTAHAEQCRHDIVAYYKRSLC